VWAQARRQYVVGRQKQVDRVPVAAYSDAPMTAGPDRNAPRQRADAARNREALLQVATEVFARSETEPSMRALAREAGVGVATLYRHFPTREALVDAVYHDQVRRLTVGAAELVAALPPAEALRRWMDVFADWMATKNGMLGTLAAMIDANRIVHADTRGELLAAIDTILRAGVEAGDIRADASAEDVAAALIGVLSVTGRPAVNPQAARLLNLLHDGLRAGSSPTGR
jgi:AcrR family transcriptional regulator